MGYVATDPLVVVHAALLGGGALLLTRSKDFSLADHVYCLVHSQFSGY